MHETCDNGLSFFGKFSFFLSFFFPFLIPRCSIFQREEKEDENNFFISHFREMNSRNRKKGVRNIGMTGGRAWGQQRKIAWKFKTSGGAVVRQLKCKQIAEERRKE